MFEIGKIVTLAEEYIKKYPPDTGYTKKVAQSVFDAYNAGKIPVGTNIGVQVALQYDGAESGGDLVSFKEKQLPYLASYSLDKGADCMDFVRNICLMLFKKNPGDWTQGAYVQNKSKQVKWDERRPMDLLLFNFKKGRDASHAALCIGNGLMLHTRSKSKPLMVTSDSIYSAGSRSGTGVFRILTDAEYASLIVGEDVEPKIKIGYARLLKNAGRPYMFGIDVKMVQAALEEKGYNLGGVDGYYGPKTEKAVLKFQKKVNCKPYDGIVGPLTWAALGFSK